MGVFKKENIFYLINIYLRRDFNYSCSKKLFFFFFFWIDEDVNIFKYISIYFSMHSKSRCYLLNST